MALAQRTLLIGFDGTSPQLCQHMMSKGKLRNLARLVKRGTLVYALTPFPTITASNWTTVATGAYPGRHTVTGYDVHHVGEPLDQVHTGFNTAECRAEHIWDVAERAGKRSLLVKYETAWPPTIRKGCVVEGCGPNYKDEFHAIAPATVFATELYPGAVPVEVQWSDRNHFDCELLLRTTAGETKRYEVVGGKRTSGVVTILRSNGPVGGKEPFARVMLGRWSAWVTDTFRMNGRRVPASFRFKLLAHPGGRAGEFRLLMTSPFAHQGNTLPRSLGTELIEAVGPTDIRGGWDVVRGEAVDEGTYLEMLDQYHTWLADVSKYLAKREPWDLLFVQTHCHDYVHHLWMRAYEPISAKKWKLDRAKATRFMEEAYESADRMLGRLLRLADRDTLIVVVADHGAVGGIGHVALRELHEILKKKGLLVTRRDRKTGAEHVVWSKTKAVPQRGTYVYVNLKGRDPQGIVRPGAEYEKVRDQIIEALYDYVDPETKVRPVTLALRREDARHLGTYGERVGDVVFAVRPEYCHEHGQGLSTGRFGLSSLEALLVLAGPGIARGRTVEGTANIADVTPTICALMDLPFPKGCQGALLYDAFAGADILLKEKRSLEKTVARFRLDAERGRSQTHRY